ncbi:MAG: dephospho-CoA kinase [Paludibacter sp.]|nr:dephospho-CoA kinase [Paludibacter sp.]
MIIGITGGIGSGKSTLSEYLRSHGFAVYDTDREAKRLQNEDSKLIENTKYIFGDNIYDNGKLDRQAVASVVFKNPDLLEKLTSIVHPIVKSDFLAWASKFNSNILIFVESAVLFESGFNELADKIILVTASEDIRIQRIMKRDGVTREQVLSRIKNQIPDAVKALKSDLVIITDNGLPDDVLQSIVVWQD